MDTAGLIYRPWRIAPLGECFTYVRNAETASWTGFAEFTWRFKDMRTLRRRVGGSKSVSETMPLQNLGGDITYEVESPVSILQNSKCN